MRDFYDIYEITKKEKIDRHTLQATFLATCKKRETLFSESEMNHIKRYQKTVLWLRCGNSFERKTILLVNFNGRRCQKKLYDLWYL